MGTTILPFLTIWSLPGTFIKCVFSFFSSILSSFGFQVSKKCYCNTSKKSFWQKFDSGSNAKYDAEFECLEKMQNHSPKRSYMPKTFAHSNKSQKLNLSVTFPLITFSAWVFFQLYCKLWSQAQTKRLKKTKNVFCKCVVNLNFATPNGLREPIC